MTAEGSRLATRWRAFRALALARFREFYREPEVVFWTFVFPILLAVALGVAFRERPPEALPVAVVSGPGAEGLAATLGASTRVRALVLDPASASRALRMGRVALAVVPGTDGGLTYRGDPTSPDSALARAHVDRILQEAAGRSDPLAVRDESVSEPGARYIDFLVPGVLGMNIMSGGLWGVGFALVDMRLRKLLKRLLATPLRRSDFMAAQVYLRVASVLFEVPFLLVFAALVFSVPVRGSWMAVLAVAALGALAFSAIGILLASRAARAETVMGFINLVSLPMMLCSGVFFSVSRFPDAIQPALRLLPLTALNDALRAVVLEGSSLASQAFPLLVLGAWTAVCFLLGLRVFRWS